MRDGMEDPQMSGNDGQTSTAFYDSLWTTTLTLDQHHKCRMHAIERLLRDLPMPTVGSRRILELGCGRGMVSSLLSRYGEIIGIDQSSVGIDAARRSVRGHFIVGVLPDIQISEDNFDVVVLSQVLEHFRNEDQTTLLRNAREKTRGDGFLILTTPNRPVSLKMRFGDGELQPIENWLAPQVLRDLLESTGWRVQRMEFAFSFFPILASRIGAFRAARYFVYDLLRLRVVFENVLSRWPVGDCTIVLAQRR